MQELIDGIAKSKSVVVLCNNTPSSVCFASAIYGLVLQNHKKVSWVVRDSIDGRFAFLPWSKEIKPYPPKSADFYIYIDIKESQKADFYMDSSLDSIILIYNTIFKSFKLNKNIATALYAALLKVTDHFKSNSVNGTVFALAKELFELGARHGECVENLANYATLQSLRIEGFMLKEFVLLRDASVAFFILDSNDFTLCKTNRDVVLPTLKKVFDLGYIKSSVVLLKNTINNFDAIVVFKDSDFEVVEFSVYKDLQDTKKEVLYFIEERLCLQKKEKIHH